MNTNTPDGTPVAIKNDTTGTFEIIRYGDVHNKIATGFNDINEVAAWTRKRGGYLGARKEHFFLGGYREIILP